MCLREQVETYNIEQGEILNYKPNKNWEVNLPLQGQAHFSLYYPDCQYARIITAGGQFFG